MPWSGSAGSKTFSRNNGTHTGATAWQQDQAAGTGIVSDRHDTHDQDISDGLNSALLKDGGNSLAGNIPAAGFGFTGLGILGSAVIASVASASTTDVLGASSLFVSVTGTTTIMSLGTGTYRWKYVRFAGSLILTHNATSLIIPGGANITTAAGDTMIIASDGSSNVWVVSYQRADGTAVVVAPASTWTGGSNAEVTVASASTCDILGAASALVAISGTTTITSLGTGTNRVRFVRFSGILTLTHNPTSLILPTGANITTAAGDTMIVESDGSSNVRVLVYQRADGTALSTANWNGVSNAEVTVASATTTDILGAASALVAISGTTTITSLGTGTNRVRFARFTGALTLTHNATSLILPGGANITTAAGDCMVVESDGSSNARVLVYQKANGTAVVASSYTPPTSSSLPLGTVALMSPQGSSPTNNNTIAGSSLITAVANSSGVVSVAGATTQSGTWTNISTATVSSGAFGLFVRTA